MRAILSAKIFFCCSIVTIFFLLYMSIKEFTNRPYSNEQVKQLLERKLETSTFWSDSTSDVKIAKSDFNNTNSAKKQMKYILQWTSARNVPFIYMGVGQEGFNSRNCPHTNCIVTADRNLLGDVKKFDVIAFSGPEVIRMFHRSLPQDRSEKQKYVFASIESSHYYPICSNRLDNFFNWTWTFRLDSEVRWGYMLIKDSNNNTIGPKKIMHWMKLQDMEPISDEFKSKLRTKTKAAAWFVSNCFDKSGRMNYAMDLKKQLGKYGLELDIYGDCGTLTCPRDKQDDCDRMLDKTYYFYLSFENSFSEDYVTEKLLHALRNNVVPVVYGGANYTRFMPNGIYLNAREMGTQKLAAKMNQLISDPEKYADYFKWKRHYTYHSLHESPETDEYCRFCAILNDEQMVKRTSVIKNFRDWWDSPKFC
ncbi:unnamed protein product [Diatraea saccharalis]|uniref:Fucosyltransferase n=1 Tax=Diatraea saccharalis TaxID=40085 RepID=A0A9N9QYP2_9NEOP|nr:unnamed protein product [Diatraea saccharalis]